MLSLPSRLRWVLGALLLATGIAIVALATDGSAVLIVLLVLPALIAGGRATALETALVAGYDVVLAIALGSVDNSFASTRDVLLVSGVAASGAAAVWLAAAREAAERHGSVPSFLEGGVRLTGATGEGADAEAESRARESAALLDTLFARAPVGLGYWDRNLRFVRVNDALAAINGIPRGEHIGRTVEEVLPELGPELAAHFRRIVETGIPMIDTEVSGETPAAPGRRRHWLASYFPVREPAGEALGIGAVVVEVTDSREAQEALARQKDLYETLLQAQSDVGEGFLLLDGGRIVYANAACEQISGLTEDELLGLPSLLAIVSPDERKKLRERILAEPRDIGVERSFETTLVRPDGLRVAVELAAKPLAEPDGRVLVIRDVSARRAAEAERDRLLELERTAREQAEEERRRSVFLAEASALLETSLDQATVFESIARLCVPYVGDAVRVDVPREDGSIAQVAAAAADPDRTAILRELGEEYPIDPSGPHPSARAIRTGATQVLEITDEVMKSIARDERHLELMRASRFSASIVAPLTARGRTLGAIFVSRFASVGEIPDRTLVEDLARRAALALDNARLYEERTHVARTLQRSLMPERLPEIPGIEVAARYRAAGAGNEVGGDFYDVIEAGPGRWSVVLGDVCGKGAEAASVTALARHTLRAAALHEEDPRAVLDLLNRALLRQDADSDFCTVVYVDVRPGQGSTGLTVASGGHPLPLLLRADGVVEQVGRPGTLMGVLESARVEPDAAEMQPGDALILFTDGVTEARNSDGLLGREGLVALLRDSAGADAEELGDRIERAAVDLQVGEPRDDIAVVVLRALDGKRAPSAQD